MNEQKARKHDVNKVKEKIKKGETIVQIAAQNDALKRRTCTLPTVVLLIAINLNILFQLS